LTVTAETIVRDLCVFPDRLSTTAAVDEALVTLLPGESMTFTIDNADGVDLDQLTARPVLRCVNDVV
jgi:beta-mannosidase